MSAAKTVVGQLTAEQDRPTAIICGNDVLAWGVLHALSRAGLSVPNEVSVTGIGDFKGSRAFEPALTTVRIPARQIGRKAGDVIARAITEDDTVIENVLIPPELIQRATSGPAQA